MRFAASAAFLLVYLLQSGCSRPGPVPSTAAPPEQVAPSRAQPRLMTIKLWLGPKEVIAEQAVTADQVQTGMMFRKEMGEDEGMIFIFGRPQRASFWMRNTLIPLSCAYIDPAGVILEIHDMKPLDETPIEAGSDQVQYVLEMKQGWFERNHIMPGTVVKTERGSLAQSYFGREQ
jgi:uncharacterized protein